MSKSLILGNVAGIKVQVHWTFLLLILWIVFMGIMGGISTSGILWNVFFVLVLFGCVILHELGHALTAKQFNIQTQQITLLPIGGVASLEALPEDPKEELLITLAGPAVNIVIAILLYLIIPFELFRDFDQEQMRQFFSEISARNFLFLLFYANIVLAAFNFIPAFPMDGGRILRSLLAMRMDRVQATQIAAVLGQFVALLFFLFGLFYNPFLALIGVFVYLGAKGENILIKQISALKGYRVKDALMTNITILNPSDSLDDVVNIILDGSERDFIVTENGDAVGVVYNKDIIKAMRSRQSELKVGNIMTTDFDPVVASEELANVLQKTQAGRVSFFPVIENGTLIGAIDVTNINEFMVFKS